MMSINQVTQRKWFYPVVYAILFIISMVPLYSEKPYLPQETQEVIISLLMVAGVPYAIYAPIFHIATLFWTFDKRNTSQFKLSATSTLTAEQTRAFKLT